MQSLIARCNKTRHRRNQSKNNKGKQEQELNTANYKLKDYKKAQGRQTGNTC